jgi:23S rRNA U2552 (ribose-2'-O)-methylase RlmE/FtsJ
MLRENNVEGIDIMQISGHKHVAFINNYSTLSEERHKKISNILSNTKTNRNALVPVQFSANLPRKTSQKCIYQRCQTIQGSVMRICVQIHIQCVDMEDCPVKHRTNFA